MKSTLETDVFERNVLCKCLGWSVCWS